MVKTPSVGEDVKELELTNIADRNVKLYILVSNKI